MSRAQVPRDARSGRTWTGYDNRPHRWYPIAVKHRYWSSRSAWWARVHIARPEGVILGIPGVGFDGPVRPILLCGADMSHPMPVGPADAGHEPCAKCFEIAARQGAVA